MQHNVLSPEVLLQTAAFRVLRNGRLGHGVAWMEDCRPGSTGVEASMDVLRYGQSAGVNLKSNEVDPWPSRLVELQIDQRPSTRQSDDNQTGPSAVSCCNHLQCFLFQNYVKHFFRYFDPENIFLDNENK